MLCETAGRTTWIEHCLPLRLDLTQHLRHGAPTAAGGGAPGELREHGPDRGAPAGFEVDGEENAAAEERAEQGRLPVPAADEEFHRVRAGPANDRQ